MIQEMLKYGLEYFGLYYGNYKGQVTNNDDPLKRGRVAVNCPTVHGKTDTLIWADPKSPMAGKSFGFWHLPDVGEWVWVSFDHGRAEYPIWEGGWWGIDEQTDDMVKNKIVLTCREGLKVIIDRTANCLILSHPAGSTITLDDTGIKLAGDTVLIDTSSLSVKGRVTMDDSAAAAPGVSGTFATVTGTVITVQDGIITDIA